MTRATNSASMREKNEKIILSLIQKAPISRAQIAKETGLTRAAVTIIVEHLMQNGIVAEGKEQAGAVGRAPIMLHLVKDAFHILGVNITRVGVFVGITDLSGCVLAERELPVEGPSRTVARIGEAAAELFAQTGIESKRVRRISVVTPGPVDAREGVILNPPHFKEWHRFPIVGALRDAIGIPAILENVSTATAVAEKYFGAAQDTDRFLALLVDEGIGSGIVLDGAPYGGASELGHTSICYDGPLCECGNRGCLEKYAAIPRVLAGTPHNTWRDAVDAEGEALEREAEYLGTAIISANNVFAFDRILLCGELVYRPEGILARVRRRIEKSVLAEKELAVASGAVTSKVAVAAAPAIHEFFV